MHFETKINSKIKDICFTFRVIHCNFGKIYVYLARLPNQNGFSWLHKRFSNGIIFGILMNKSMNKDFYPIENLILCKPANK